MIKAKLAIKKFLNKIRNYFSSPLPIGMTEHKAWADSIINTYDFPDNDSVRFSMAVMIMHFKETAAFLPKREVMLRIRKSMANQVAAQVVNDLKQKQAEEQAAAVQLAEATATSVASNGQKQ